MATVITKISGGSSKDVEASTLGELKKILGVEKYQATIGGEPEDDDSYELSANELVLFSEKTKGA